MAEVEADEVTDEVADEEADVDAVDVCVVCLQLWNSFATYSSSASFSNSTVASQSLTSDVTRVLDPLAHVNEASEMIWGRRHWFISAISSLTSVAKPLSPEPQRPGEPTCSTVELWSSTQPMDAGKLSGLPLNAMSH